MTQAIVTPVDFIPFDAGGISRKVSSQVVPGAVILGLSALMGSAWMSFMHPAAFPHTAKAPAIARAAVAPVAVTPAVDAGSNSYGALFDPGFFSGSKSVSLSQNFTLEIESPSLTSKFRTQMCGRLLPQPQSRTTPVRRRRRQAHNSAKTRLYRRRVPLSSDRRQATAPRLFQAASWSSRTERRLLRTLRPIIAIF